MTHTQAWRGWGRQPLAALVLLGGVATLAGCGSVGGGVGVGIPIGPFSVGVGLGTGGLSAGVSTGVGPVGVGVGVNQRGQVTGHTGVGVSTGLGAARVGVGVGGSTVLHDPAAKTRAQTVPAGEASAVPIGGAPAPAAVVPAAPQGAVQWRDANGHLVPTCRVEGRC